MEEEIEKMKHTDEHRHASTESQITRVCRTPRGCTGTVGDFQTHSCIGVPVCPVYG